MRRLLVLRHAKSDWKADFDRDHQRPLAPRGLAAAHTMGTGLAALGQVPDRVLSSSAVRARTTVEAAVEAGAWRCPVAVEPALYEASSAGVLDLLRTQDDRHRSLLVAGHEPTCSELVANLIGGGEVRFPTAAIARVDLDIERWSDLQPGLGHLAWLLTPKLVKRLASASGARRAGGVD